MDMSGEYRIPAPREEVWAALNDPEVLKSCIPGCKSLEKTSDTEMAAEVTAKVGPVKANFKGTVTLSDLDPPNSYRITGEGKGGAAGFAKGGANVQLSEENNETVLNYTAKAQVGGKLAQLGSRLIDGAAKKTADDFFGNLVKKLEGNTANKTEQNFEEDVGHGDNISDVAREIGEAVHDAEEALEVEAGKGTLGGPAMWGIMTLAILIVLLLVLS